MSRSVLVVSLDPDGTLRTFSSGMPSSRIVVAATHDVERHHRDRPCQVWLPKTAAGHPMRAQNVCKDGESVSLCVSKAPIKRLAASAMCLSAAPNCDMTVCVLPGTELAFAGDVACLPAGLLGWKTKTINHQTAIFNKDKLAAHYDALEFPDGRTVLLTVLCQGQEATVLQLPARPTSAAEADAQKRVT
jgi:hypothetical protein